eukprot:gene4867-3325_t
MDNETRQMQEELGEENGEGMCSKMGDWHYTAMERVLKKKVPRLRWRNQIRYSDVHPAWESLDSAVVHDGEHATCIRRKRVDQEDLEHVDSLATHGHAQRRNVPRSALETPDKPQNMWRLERLRLGAIPTLIEDDIRKLAASLGLPGKQVQQEDQAVLRAFVEVELERHYGYTPQTEGEK